MSYRVRNRQIEVLKDSNVSRFASYFNANEISIGRLEKAYQEEDESEMRRVISSATDEDFMDPLQAIYSSVIIEIAKKVLSNNRRYLSPGGKKLAQESAYQPSVRPPDIDKLRVTIKKDIEAKDRWTGKKYMRSRREWTIKELTFLKRNQDKSGKELSRIFNKYFDRRTTSSILTQKIRVKKDPNIIRRVKQKRRKKRKIKLR